MGDPSRTEKPAVDLATKDERVSRPEPQSQRLAPARPIDLGEQIVGSRHRFDAPLPLNADTASGAAVAKIKPEGSADFRLAFDGGIFNAVHVLRPMQPSTPAVLEFDPRRVGIFDGDLVVAAEWADGHREEQKIAVHASARNLDQIPSSTVVPDRQETGTKRQRPEIAPVDNKNVDNEFSGAITDLSSAAGAVIQQQLTGVGAAQAEMLQYKREQPVPSRWWDLLETALIAGTAGIAAMVGNLAVRGLDAMLAEEPALAGVEKTIAVSGKTADNAAAHDVEHAAGHVTAPHAGPEVGHASTDQATHVTDHAASSATHDDAHHEPGHGMGELSKEGVGAAVEDGFKDPINKALDEEPKEEQSSSAIDFFTKQQSRLGLANRKATVATLDLQRTLLPLLRSNRGAAVSIVEAATVAMDAAWTPALKSQQDVTSAEYATYVARASIGSVEAQAPSGKSETVTNVAEAREYTKDRQLTSMPAGSDGLLDIFVDLNGPVVNVTGARLKGISHLTADRFIMMHLGDPGLRLPLRFVLSDGVITRDEAGRVDVTGYQHVDPSTHAGIVDDTQENLSAERIVATVLGRTLHEWNVPKIQTDDANDKHNEGK